MSSWSRGAAPPPHPPKPCVNYVQVGVGLAGAGLGAAQAIEGAAEALIGIGLTPETFGASLLLTGKGVVDMGIGGLAVSDGMSLVETGFNGVQNGSTLGQIGEQAGGHFGGSVGESATYGLALKGILDAARTGKASNLGIALNVLNAVAASYLMPCQ